MMVGKESGKRFSSIEQTRVDCFKLFILKGVGGRLKDGGKALFASALCTNFKVDMGTVDLSTLEFTEHLNASELAEIFKFLNDIKSELTETDAFIGKVLSAVQRGLSLNSFMTLNVTLPALKRYFISKHIPLTASGEIENVLCAINTLLKSADIKIVVEDPASLKEAHRELVLKNHPDKVASNAEKEECTKRFVDFTSLRNDFLKLASNPSNSQEYAAFGIDYFISLLEQEYRSAFDTIQKAALQQGTRQDDGKTTLSKEAYAKLANQEWALKEGMTAITGLSDIETLDDVQIILQSRITKERLRMVSMHLRTTFWVCGTFMAGFPGISLLTALSIAVVPSLANLHHFKRRSPFKHTTKDALYEAAIYGEARSLLVTPLPYFFTALLALPAGTLSPKALPVLKFLAPIILLDAALIAIYTLYVTKTQGWKYAELGDFFSCSLDGDYLGWPQSTPRKDDPLPYFRCVDKFERFTKPVIKYLIPLTGIVANTMAVLEASGLDSSKSWKILPYINTHPILSLIAIVPAVTIPLIPFQQTLSHWHIDCGIQVLLALWVGESLRQSRTLGDISVGLFNLSAFPLSTKIVALEIAVGALCGISVYALSKEYRNSRQVLQAAELPTTLRF